uniref:Mediator of RNA polymerase II transcription subunit 22 n=1 Tax=Gasterosteus aculeatus aculeatus TaxID=481459 RepID=G3PAE1_GASAC
RHYFQSVRYTAPCCPVPARDGEPESPPSKQRVPATELQQETKRRHQVHSGQLHGDHQNSEDRGRDAGGASNTSRAGPLRDARPSGQHRASCLQNQQLRSLQEECDKKLTSLRDEIAIDLYELEEEYYSSSYSQWDSTDLPLYEAYRRQDSWASPGSSCSSTTGDREDVEGAAAQETNGQHHLNGHGAASIEKP